MVKTKQKAQNVNYLMLVCILFYHLTSIGQTNITGTYSTESTSMTFFENGDFSYKTGGDLGEDDYGKGVYSFNGQKLILNFNKTKLGNISSYSHYKIWQNKKNDVEILVTVLDFNGKPIPGATIFCSQFKQQKQTNKDGTGTLNLPKKTKYAEITVRFLGYKESKTLINLRFNHKITVFLSAGELEGVPILNQIDTLTIVSFKNRYFKEKNKKGELVTWVKDKS